MIVVTGAAGFIGSNLVRRLNERGCTDILVVDHLQPADKFLNLRDCRIADYMGKEAFRHAIETRKFSAKVEAVFHQGACSDTMVTDGEYVMDNNFTYSKILLHYALDRKVPFVYASSASVYGDNACFTEDPANEKPLNAYGYSKLLFDQYVRRLPKGEGRIVGLRYFNVYGPHEFHKGRMASMVYRLYHTLRDGGVTELFRGTDGFGDGEQKRDFVHVADVVAVNLFFAWGERAVSGIYNVGTGMARSFNDVVKNWMQRLKRGGVKYIPFPPELHGKYQSYTQADLSALRAAGYTAAFLSLEEGIARYHQFLEGGSAPADPALDAS